MVNAVEVNDLTVKFDAVVALDGVTHTFEPGTATAVMGVNGSGKTTMLECLAGLQKPTSGRIRGMPKKLGYTCQHLPASWMPITAGEVMAMGRYRERGLIGRLGSADRAAIRDAGERLDVNQLADRAFGSLSGGQQQRVRIAQVLAGEPEVIMLDEPVTGLDIPSQERILDVVEQCTARGAIVITYHPPPRRGPALRLGDAHGEPADRRGPSRQDAHRGAAAGGVRGPAARRPCRP